MDEQAQAMLASDGPRPPTKPKQRLASLDVVRGFTVALMIFVDDVGDAYPALNHSPWDNVTLADAVMPWFLFMVGASMSISLRKHTRPGAPRKAATHHVLVRTLKLFLLGLLLQGGGWIDPGGAYAYGFNLCTLRWMGILQRIAFGYGCAALIELYVPGGERTCTAPAVASADALAPEAAEAPRPSHAALFVRHRWQWLLVLSPRQEARRAWGRQRRR